MADTEDNDEEPITRVSRHEQRVVQQEVTAFNRRAEDRFFDRWIKPIIGWAVLIIIAAAIKTWIDVGVLQINVARLQIDNASRVSTEALTIRDERIKNLESALQQLQAQRQQKNP